MVFYHIPQDEVVDHVVAVGNDVAQADDPMDLRDFGCGIRKFAAQAGRASPMISNSLSALSCKSLRAENVFSSMPLQNPCNSRIAKRAS